MDCLYRHMLRNVSPDRGDLVSPAASPLGGRQIGLHKALITSNSGVWTVGRDADFGCFFGFLLKPRGRFVCLLKDNRVPVIWDATA